MPSPAEHFCVGDFRDVFPRIDVWSFWQKLVNLLAVSILLCSSLAATAQTNQLFIDPRHPAIDYFSEAQNVVSRLDSKLAMGEHELVFEANTSYLRSLLEALDIPIESQIAVYSKTSLQKPLISANNPRTIFFNDAVSVAWIPGGLIEIAALDTHKGAVFYSLRQANVPEPRLRRETGCLTCHVSGQTHSVPGFLVNSIPAAADGSILPWLGNGLVDHRSAFAERWAGWFVTGEINNPHLGNMVLASADAQELPANYPPALATLDDQINTRNYLTPYSDIAALMVFDHQMQMMNLLTRLSWEGRLADQQDAASILRQTAIEVVDYMLFIDEATPQEVQGGSGFSETFNARGPFDSKGRSLRTLELKSRLLQYHCSYMIYSEVFAALPAVAKDAVYLRLAEVLYGTETGVRYTKLTAPLRRDIIEILRETKDALPAYFAQGLTE